MSARALSRARATQRETRGDHLNELVRVGTTGVFVVIVALGLEHRAALIEARPYPSTGRVIKILQMRTIRPGISTLQLRSGKFSRAHQENFALKKI